MALSYNDVASLISGSVVDNNTQDITADVMKDVLQRFLEFANEHTIDDNRLNASIARMADVNFNITTAKTQVKTDLQGVPNQNHTLASLYAEILALQTAINGANPPSPVPAGVICMWSGTLPPTGWSLCDGTNNTPNLSGRFIVAYHPTAPDLEYREPGNLSDIAFHGTGTSQQPGSGGTPSHTLGKENIPRHSHDVKSSSSNGANVSIASSGAHSHSTNAIRNDAKVLIQSAFPVYQETVNGHVATATVSSASHTHTNANFSGKVGDGRNQGLPSTPSALDNRPLFYTLAYIMKDQ